MPLGKSAALVNNTAMRPVIIHYHIYKNAGTSVDACLQQNFGDRWAAFESEDNSILQVEDLEKFIQSNPDINAISSHTAQIALPKLQNILPIPIIFFRHPIDRIRSVYDFERADKNNKAPFAKFAQTGNFEDYYIWRLTSFTPWQVANFQSFKFKDFFEPIPPMEAFRFRENCMRALKALEYVGLVENFDHSMSRFAMIIKQSFPDFVYTPQHENATNGREAELNARLNRFRKEIGPKLYLNLQNLNAVDLECYESLKGFGLES